MKKIPQHVCNAPIFLQLGWEPHIMPLAVVRAWQFSLWHEECMWPDNLGLCGPILHSKNFIDHIPQQFASLWSNIRLTRDCGVVLCLGYLSPQSRPTRPPCSFPMLCCQSHRRQVRFCRSDMYEADVRLPSRPATSSSGTEQHWTNMYKFGKQGHT